LRAWLDDSISLSTEQYVSPVAIASLYARLGEKSHALEWLERGYQLRDADLVELGTDPIFDFLHSDPAYVALLHRIGLPQPR
jgi:hypothetical protein